MATSNFEKVNTNSIFVFEGIYDSNGSEDLLNCISFLEDDLKKVFKTFRDKKNNLYVQHTYEYYGVNWELCFTPFVKQSYLGDYYLDLIIEVGTDYASFNENPIEVIVETIENSTKNIGLLKANERNLVKKLGSEADKIINNIEKIFRKNTVEYKIIATCNNGEQILEKVAKAIDIVL